MYCGRAVAGVGLTAYDMYQIENNPLYNQQSFELSKQKDEFDEEITKFKLKFIGRQDLKTKFGVVPSMIFRPYVQAGRVFKEQESLTVWISDDDNKLPIRIKTELAIGSLNADLEKFKGLKHCPRKLNLKNQDLYRKS